MSGIMSGMEMTLMWRPKVWNNPHNVYQLDSLHSQIEDTRLHRAYEAGADAILKALQVEFNKSGNTFDTIETLVNILGGDVN